MRRIAVLVMLLAGCDVTDPAVAGYEDGCTDGVDFGYANGLMQGENCMTYDDDPGERLAEDGDAYEQQYNLGYTECYPDGYADGYNEGSVDAEC